jgi:sn-glycerol 3-phosphate transport system ATP-binding protein
MSQISLQNLKKSFGKTKVIHDLSIDVKNGELIVIVGPSGCGKSTLLRMVAGLEDANEGNILIDNKKVNELEPMERNIAMVFQNYALYPHMSVFDNMAYGLKIAKVPKNEIESRVQKAAEILELDELLQRKPNQLSGGQRQRVAMGRAIVRNPVVFLFDEPLSNLDAKLRVQMRLEIKKLQTQLKTTSLYVTHDQVEAMTLADRMIVMNNGNVEHIGTPLEVYTKPKTLFTAQFIGSPAMNIINGECKNKQISFRNGATLKTNSEHNGKVNVGLRPEDFKVDENGPIKLKVELVELIGANTLIHGKLENSEEVLVASIAGVVSESKIGKNIGLSFDESKLHLFDMNSDQRIN